MERKKHAIKRLILVALLIAVIYLTVSYVIWENFILNIPDNLLTSIIFFPLSVAYMIDFGSGGYSFFLIMLLETVILALFIFIFLFVINNLRNINY